MFSTSAVPHSELNPRFRQGNGQTGSHETRRTAGDSGQKSSSGKLTQGHPKLGNIVPGVFTPVLAKHTKSFNLVDTLSVGVDKIQWNFERLQRQVELWRKTQINDDTAKLIFYTA